MSDINSVMTDGVNKMNKAVDVAKDDLAAIRTGRAHPSLFNKVIVDYYGAPTALNQLASVQIPEARVALINPFDKGAMSSIEKALRESDLGVNPSNDGVSIRINFPQLTEERRKEYIKLAKSKGEDSKVSIRNIRRAVKEALEKLEKDGEISKDDLARAEKELEKHTGDHTAKIDELLKHKEAELLEVQANQMSDLHAINDAINKRAGRKLLPSIATSLSLMALVWALLKYFPAGFASLVALALVLAIKELAHAFSSSDTYVSKRSLMLSSVGLSAGAWFGGIRGLAIGLGIALCLMLIALLRKGPQGFVKSASASVFALVYLPFLAGFLILLARPHNGLEQVMVFVILVASNDTFAYVTGVLIGKHPMAPKHSPKKTWEGLAGSIIFTTILGYLTFDGILKLNPWVGAAVGLLIVFTATTGDLIESSIKRDFAIKDMGDLLPGHGGVMDRLDSIVLSAPALWLVLELVKHFS